MKILVIGGGGREHAIVKKLKQSPRVSQLFALPGNGGIAADATLVPIGAKEIDKIVAFATDEGIDFAVVAPDDPLALGAVDALQQAGIPCFGPDKKAAEIESSKVFSKNLMKKYGIPTAAFEVFDSEQKALSYLDSAPIPTVIKADGLALGKGVTLAYTREEARAAVHAMMGERVFGESGARILIEEMLEGPEVSVLATASGLSPWSAPWITSVRSTATRAPTPVAWAPSPPTPTTQRRSPPSAWRPSLSPPSKPWSRRAAPFAAAFTLA